MARVTYDGKPRLYGLGEAAAYLGVSRRRLYQLYHRPSKRTPIVEPYTKIGGRPVWSESQLDQMLYQWRDDPLSHPRTRERAAERVLEIEALQGLARVRGTAYSLLAAKNYAAREETER